jgi:hypothetical protein
MDRNVSFKKKPMAPAVPQKPRNDFIALMRQAKKVDERSLGLIQTSRTVERLPKFSDINEGTESAKALSNRKPSKKKIIPSKSKGPKIDTSSLVKLNTVKRDLRTIEEIQEEIMNRKKLATNQDKKTESKKKSVESIDIVTKKPEQREKIMAMPIKDLNAQM